MSSSYDRNKDLKAFDERKSGVKGVVDGGAEHVPTIFVRSEDDLSKELSTCEDGSLVVPVIDLTHVHVHVHERNSQTQEIMRRMVWASEKWGFFQVTNHGIPMEVVEKVVEDVRKFHEQEAEVKKEYYSRNGMKQFRFNTNYDLHQSRCANWRDTLYVTTSFTAQLDPQELPPVCRDALSGYVDHVLKLADLLLELLSMGLGLEPNCLGDLRMTEAWNLVGHYYPACPEPELTLGASKHTDPSFLTILAQDHIGGLQVVHQNQWVNVKPVPGALIVNIGDILQIVSNDRLKSVRHRVIANKIGPRISIATFFTGLFSSTKKYGPIEELISEENPPLYKEFTLQEFFKHFFTRPLDQRDIQYFRLSN